jgi:hypothetical protein
MTIATQLARVPVQLEVFCPLFGGPIWGGVAETKRGLAEPARSALASARMVFIPVTLEGYKANFPEILQWKTDWLCFGVPGTDIQAGHVRSDGVVAYRITHPPVTHYGFVLAPARKETELPTVPSVGAGGYRSPLWILGVSA